MTVDDILDTSRIELHLALTLGPRTDLPKVADDVRRRVRLAMPGQRNVRIAQIDSVAKLIAHEIFAVAGAARQW